MSSPYWNSNRGAAILCQADGSTTGTFSNSNSLVGANANDYVSSAGVTPLLNNNYVVSSPNWNGKSGAVTLCQSDGSTIGSVTSNNSLVGTNPNDSVGGGNGFFRGGGAIALTNGNYVVTSPKWNNYKGAITWGNGLTGVTGQVSSANSLVGVSSGDRLGMGGMRVVPVSNRDTTLYYQGVFTLNNGNYIVGSVGWNGNTGAVTWCNGQKGTGGTVNSQNSLTGISNTYNPNINSRPSMVDVVRRFTSGFATNPELYDAGTVNYDGILAVHSYRNTIVDTHLRNLTNYYIVQGIDATTNRATITWGNGTIGTTGSANSCNTVYGTLFNGTNNMIYAFDSVYNYLLVGRGTDNIVSRYYPALGATSPAGNDNSAATVSGNPVVFSSTTGCGQIAALTPSGANPVSGSVTAKTWLENPQPADFVARHYEITPVTNASIATGTVTLYFTQADFDGFNNQSPAPALKLPIGPSDGAGISSLLVQKEGGSSNVGTGLPGTYPGPVSTIDPNDNNILWNTALSRWEVSFDLTGFSGFFIKTKLATTLPLQLLNFSGQRQGNLNLLQWKTSNEINTKSFVVENSATGNSFFYVGTVPATGGGIYSFIDNYPPANRTCYRLKMIDVDGKFTYSNIIWINGTGNNSITLYPNPVTNSTTLNIGNNNTLIGTQAQLTDASGRLLQLFSINNRQEQLILANLPAGLYFLKLKDGNELKIFKQ